jgi:hypothetical protein
MKASCQFVVPIGLLPPVPDVVLGGLKPFATPAGGPPIQFLNMLTFAAVTSE